MTIKRCKSSFAVTMGGAPRVVTVGTLVEDGDPILQGREQYFEDAETYVSDRAARVEQATAAPGERRSVSRLAARKTAARKPDPKADPKGESQTDGKGDAQ